MYARDAVRVQRVFDGLEVVWVLRDQPRVVLQPQTPLLRSPHSLHRDRHAETGEVIELELFRVLEPLEERLDTPQFHINYAEHGLDPVMPPPSGPMTR
jgi:hypothetical protein